MSTHDSQTKANADNSATFRELTDSLRKSKFAPRADREAKPPPACKSGRCSCIAECRK